MIWNFQKVVRIKTVGESRLHLEFDDGVSGEVDLSRLLRSGPVFAPLRDPNFFRKVALNEYGAPFWPCGVDLAPDALYQTLTSSFPGHEA